MNLIDTLNNRKILKIVFYSLIFSYGTFLLLFTFLFNFKGLILTFLLITSFIVRHIYYINNKRVNGILIAFFPILEYVMLLFLFYQSISGIEQIVFMLFMTDIILHYKAWYSIIFSYIGYIVYIFLWPSESNKILLLLIDLLAYTFVIIPIWSTKLLLKQKMIIEMLNKALLNEAKTAEEMAALRERNRIAKEVHDSVGHILTTSIVSLEGAKILFNKNPDESYNKISIVREQLKNSLGNIRNVVRELDQTKDIKITLKKTINSIIENVKMQASIEFEHKFRINEEHLVSLQKYVITNIVKEAITNSIKHGKATKINVLLEEINETINIAVYDNGIGCETIKYGFGLNSMHGKINAIGGKLIFKTSFQKGFEIKAILPIAKGEN